jgi:hypothetical protein
MDLIGAADADPAILLRPEPIDVVRPCRCDRCGNVDGDRLAFHGNGIRQREAVLPGRHWAKPARIVVVAVRRFECTGCGAAPTVLPRGLLPRHLYSLFAIVHALWLAVAPPIGQGRDDEEVYAHQGVDRLAADRHRTGVRRWRSLARWTMSADRWWPTLAVAGETWRDRATSLIAAFVSAGEAPAAVARSAVDRHAGRGAVM